MSDAVAAAEACSTESAQQLLETLRGRSPGRRWRLIERPRFARPALVGRLLAASEAQLRQNPAEAEDLAQLAVRLAFRLEPALRDMASEAVRAFCLMGHARRLLGDFRRAEVAFERASLLALDERDRGRHCRGLGILRWEAGRWVEAMALLEESAQRFELAGARAEAGVSRALHALFLLEEREEQAAWHLLIRAQPALGPDDPPGLRARVTLALALHLARRGETSHARTLRAGVWHASPRIDRAELLPLLWLEGRLAGSLGDRKGGLALLEAVWRGYLQKERWPEPALVMLDQGSLVAKPAELAELYRGIAELETAFTGQAGLPESVAALHGLCGEIEKSHDQAPQAAEQLAKSLRAELWRRRVRSAPWLYA